MHYEGAFGLAEASNGTVQRLQNLPKRADGLDERIGLLSPVEVLLSPVESGYPANKSSRSGPEGDHFSHLRLLW
jgi:hypothetical protein